MANYTKKDILRLVADENVEFIRLQFTDIFGQLKNVAITASQLGKALSNQIMIDGSSIEGFTRIHESDQYLYPDPASFTLLPWASGTARAARLICDVYNPDGKPFVGDPRGVLKRALARADAAELADKPLPELSGGERQCAYLAMALSQETASVLMDEPTAFLDAAHQLAVMDTAASLAREGRAVVLVLHDLCLALRRADSIAVMDSGAVTAWGGADEVFASSALERAFKVKIRRVMTPDGWQYYYV